VSSLDAELDLSRNAVVAARALIGWSLVVDGVGGPIVEAEAYRGSHDPAAHSYRGRTERNRAMFGPPGTLYVYRSYGIHWCVNVVCAPEGVAEAVLVRALEPRVGIDRMQERRGVADPRRLCCGPGNVGQALGIGPQLNGVRAVLEPPERARRVVTATRVGITRAAELEWRFLDADSPFVSRAARAPAGPPARAARISSAVR
jgi:DNA-3-methyladenine glycosylase